jgi:hypothetical protein
MKSRLMNRRKGTSPAFRVMTAILPMFLGLLLGGPASARENDPAPGPRRVLSVRNRASVVIESPGQTARLRADNLISGRPARVWRSRKGDAPPFVFVFALSIDSHIKGLRFFNSANEDKMPGIGARTVEVEFSMTGPDSDFYPVGVFELKKGPEPEVYEIPKSPARWVRLTILSNHGHPHFTELGEFEAWGQFDLHLNLVIPYFIWISGAALMLAAFSYHDHMAHRRKIRLRDALRLPSFLRPAAVGAVLFGAGVAAAARSPILAVSAAGLAMAAVVVFIGNVRRLRPAIRNENR